MPPPRLIRPPRPCHPRQSTPQVRWASNAARDQLSAHRDDPTRTADASSNTQPSAQTSAPERTEAASRGKAEERTGSGTWYSNISTLLFGRTEVELRENGAEPIPHHVSRSSTSQSPPAFPTAASGIETSTLPPSSSHKPKDPALAEEHVKKTGKKKTGKERTGRKARQKNGSSTPSEPSVPAQPGTQSIGTSENNTALYEQLQQLVKEVRRLNQRLDARESRRSEAKSVPRPSKVTEPTNDSMTAESPVPVVERPHARAGKKSDKVEGLEGHDDPRTCRQEKGRASIVMEKQKPDTTSKAEAFPHIRKHAVKLREYDDTIRIRKTQAPPDQLESPNHDRERLVNPLRKLKHHLFTHKRRMGTTLNMMSMAEEGLRNSSQSSVLHQSLEKVIANSGIIRAMIGTSYIRLMGRDGTSAHQRPKTVDLQSPQEQDTSKLGQSKSGNHVDQPAFQPMFKRGVYIKPVEKRGSAPVVAESFESPHDTSKLDQSMSRDVPDQVASQRMFNRGIWIKPSKKRGPEPVVARSSESFKSSEDAVGVDRPSQAAVMKLSDKVGGETQRLIRKLHTKATNKDTSEAKHEQLSAFETPIKEPASSSIEDSSESSGEDSEQTLLEELFPEASSYVQPHYTQRNPYPKLDLPDDIPLVRPTHSETPKSQRQQMLESFQTRMEPITVLQLLHCSTQLTEMDFRRLVPKGKHIESWVRDGEFTKVIPGRDPLSLERRPFYYLLFKSAEGAQAYQNNVARLHKLAGLHQPSSIFSAIPPPKGFLEDGEDLSTVLSSYLLQPTSLKLNLSMVMQPYNPTFRALVEAGGYKPIVPSVGSKGEKIWKVLLHIEGWEPSQLDLYHSFVRQAQDRGLSWQFHDGANSIRKLRDLVNLKARLLATAAPRAANPSKHDALSNGGAGVDSDPNFGLPTEQDDGDGSGKPAISQLVMNRLYNRWIVEFVDEDAAQRFARMWNRRVLPAPKFVTWRDTEEVRMVNAEFLW